MKVVILAGGFGTRISEESQYKPKPMLEIGEPKVIVGPGKKLFDTLREKLPNLNIIAEGNLVTVLCNRSLTTVVIFLICFIYLKREKVLIFQFLL